MLIDVLPATEARMRVLNTIYNNKDINIRSIIKLSKTSPNLAVDYINQLETYQLVSIRKIGGAKKKYIKAASFNFKAEFSRIFYTIIETNKKEELLEKYKILKPFITQIKGAAENKAILLIYGSYARFEADKESDLDIWVIGNLDKKLRKDIQEILVTLPVEYSISIETKKEFLKKINTPIHQNIMRDRVIIAGGDDFFDILAKSQ